MMEDWNMQIGEPQRVIIVEPLELPIGRPERTEPNPEPDPEPTFVAEPEPEPETVRAANANS
jgi:hypothetical protein